ncbi:hypothetical protein NKI48_17670, partial [Mesorhizobium sp. M0644]|uniref:hypothetical protein n=1 Tax=Mesorhizobium sp. M0644 TaxID=2956979 RepID=UPI00333AB917
RQWLAKQRYRGAHALELPPLNGISYPLTLHHAQQAAEAITCDSNRKQSHVGCSKLGGREGIKRGFAPGPSFPAGAYFLS